MAKNAVVSRILGPAHRGVFGALGVVPDFFASLGSLGFGPAMVYHVAREGEDPRQALGSLLLFAPVTGLLLAGLCHVLMARGLVSGENAELLAGYAPFLLAAIPFTLLRRLGQDLLMGQSSIRAFNLSRFLETFFPFLLFLILWGGLGFPGLEAAVWGWFVSLVLNALVPVAALVRGGFRPARPSLSFIRRNLAYGLRGHVGDIFHLTLLRLDFMFLAAMAGPADLGHYAVATSMAEILLVLPEAVFISSIGAVMRMDRSSSERFTPLAVKVVGLGMLVACLGVGLLGRPVILLLFGPNYLPAYEPLALLTPGMLFLSVFYLLKADFLRRKRPGTVSVCSAVAAGLNVALNLALIPRLGVSGAAVASSISYGLSMLLLTVLYLRASGLGAGRLLLFNAEERASLRRIPLGRLARRGGRGHAE